MNKEEKARLERIKWLRDEIKQCKKEKNVVRLKNTLKGVLFSLPIVIPTIVGSVHIAKTKDIPGHRDYKDEYARTKMEYSSSSEMVEIEKQYMDYEDNVDSISYYGAWDLQDDGSYERTVKTYELENISEEKLIELSKKDIITVDDLLDFDVKNTKESTQKKYNVSREELDLGSFYEFTVYGADEKDTIKVMETSDEAFYEGVKLAFMVGVVLATEVGIIDSFKPKFEDTICIDKNIRYYTEEIEYEESKISNPVKIKK